MIASLPHAQQDIDGTAVRRAVAIGNVDGVHRGHQALLSTTVERAERLGVQACLLTFEPHPAHALGGSPPPQLTSLPRKLALLRALFPSLEVDVYPFTLQTAMLSPADFCANILQERLRAQHVLVGADFRFGHQRSGNLESLRTLGEQHAFTVEGLTLLCAPGTSENATEATSSSKIRGELTHGNVSLASALLGRPHSVSGVVVRGEQRGRELGFPTCNIEAPTEMLPARGVYFVTVDLVTREDAHTGSNPTHAERCTALAVGIANIGIRPTVTQSAANPSARLEVHLFDRNLDLYGQSIRVHFLERVRGEQKFSGLAELKAQVDADIHKARRWFAQQQGLGPDACAMRASAHQGWFCA